MNPAKPFIDLIVVGIVVLVRLAAGLHRTHVDGQFAVRRAQRHHRR
jgi:hypothetical protein